MYSERARIETPCDFESMHSRVMMWQPHCLGDALPPHLKGRDVSEHTQVELFYSEHSCGQVEFKAILSQVIFVIFNIFGFIENKRSSKLFILCVVILEQAVHNKRH
jgi:hypothetical protein